MSRDVLVVTPDFPPTTGGIQTLFHHLVTSLDRYRPRVITLDAPGSDDFDQREPFDVRRARLTRMPRPLRVGALNLLALWSAVRVRPAVIVSGHIVVGPAALIARAATGARVVQYAHAQELARRPSLARFVLRRADATIAVSEHTRSLVVELGARERRVHVIQPGVESAPETAEPNGRERSIVVVGRLVERYKGHDVLLRALPLVRERVGNVHLHVVGDGRLREELTALADALGLGDAVTFHGSVGDDERDAILLRSAVFAMPSRIAEDGSGEGFGIAFLEAGSFGLPVVAGNVGGALDAVVDGETGLLVDPTSHGEVARALVALLSDSHLASRMGEAGRTRAATFSWDRMGERVQDVLDEVSAA